MEPESQDNDVYGLVRGLSESLFRQYRRQGEEEEQQQRQHPYAPQEDNERHLRRLKARAYEILLNKSGQDHAKDREQCDPIVELLKHAFVLKVGAGRISQADELGSYLDECINNGLEPDSVVYKTLQFLNCLKSVEFDDESSLDIFHYGKPHPSLPEMLYDRDSVPPFQVYPSESFHLPKKFESMFKNDHGSVIRYNAAEPGSKLALLGRFTSSSGSNIQSTRHNNDIDSNMSIIPKRTTNLLNGMDLTLSSYFIPQIKYLAGSDDQFQTCKEVIVTEPESPWQCPDPLQWFSENSLPSIDNQTEICEIEENDNEEEEKNLDKIWEHMDKISPLSSHRTWETLGSFDPPKEAPFVSESIEATLHLINVAQNNILPNQLALSHPINEVPRKEFISNIKLMLLGVESNTFIYNPATGFELKKNIAIHGISSRTLQNMCYEVTHWGTCFRNLSNLIVPDPQTEKLQIEGLIFKALCGSIKEFLLFYHAAILRVSLTEDRNIGILAFLNKVRALGNLILKVAELCRCDSERSTSLGEGIGILTHIYKEVTKVTEQRVALVFYSILRDCCEVYFRFLQHWIFEGVCADIYEEFMIRVRPQYLRTRGHRFWTRGFSINAKSVPGFLAKLTETILQCGKAVTLLKICDPQNPLCRASAASQPPVRVCLSVGMLREQAKYYEEYTSRGEIAQGEEVSLSSAIREQKEAEKRRAELVIAAQQDTLLRLRKEREDELREITKKKSDLLEMLKDQAEEAAQRKERDRDAELLADRLLLEGVLKHEEEARNAERAEREQTIMYYEELAEEARRRRVHADWRIKRMKLFDERVQAIGSMRREFVNTPDDGEAKSVEGGSALIPSESTQTINQPTDPKDPKQQQTNTESDLKKQENAKTESFVVSELPTPDGADTTAEALSEDENSNPTSAKIDELLTIKQQNINALDERNRNVEKQQQQQQSSKTKAVRPTVLDITGANSQMFAKDSDRLDGPKKQGKTGKTQTKNSNIDQKALDLLTLNATDNMTAAQRNKLKVLHSEYGITPNNNESATILNLAITNPDDQTEIQSNRLRNTQHLTHLNWENIEGNENLRKHLEEDIINEEQTEIQTNRLRNTQHLTHLNWEDIKDNENLRGRLEVDGVDEEKTEIQTNRLRNTQHLTHLNWEDIEDNENLRGRLEVDGIDEEKTEIQLNRLRNTQHMTHLNWEDVEGNDNLKGRLEEGVDEEKTEIQRNRLRNTQHLTHLNWEDVEANENLIGRLEEEEIVEEKTEIQRNRLRNTQHLTHLNWKDVEGNENLGGQLEEEGIVEEKTEIQRNRLRNTQHLTHLNWEDVERENQHTRDEEATAEKQPLTDAQINRNRVMSHFYNRMDELEEHPAVKPENLTDWQRNRNRNMAHNTDRFDFELNRFAEYEQQHQHFRETPMSTATDHFTVSTHSGSLLVPSCENTPFSEITNHSDMLFARSASSDSASRRFGSGRGSRHFPDTPSHPEFIGLAGTPSSEHQQQRLTIADVEMIDTTSLQVYLEKSVVIPLAVQSRLVNNAIIKYLLTEHKMLSHLHSLRSYFFLLNGEFGRTLTQSLFARLYEVSAPVELFNSSTLGNFLEKALVSSLSGTYANSELISLSAADVPAYLQTSNPEILSCLSLNYKISWPLNIIFNDVVMQQYSRVFKFLLMVGRVLWVLQEDFQILKIERKAAITENHHKLQLYRHSMMQFMNALHTYLTCSVLHASWSEFEKDLENATTLDEVYETHVSYIKKILSRCMLNVRGEKMRTCLCNIFKVVLKFHNRIRSQNWSAVQSAGPNYENLERMYVAFCEQRAYLAHVAEKLANSGYQPHLMQFLHALNINHRYDLCAAKK